MEWVEGFVWTCGCGSIFVEDSEPEPGLCGWCDEWYQPDERCSLADWQSRQIIEAEGYEWSHRRDRM